jgi:hypothetical protein
MAISVFDSVDRLDLSWPLTGWVMETMMDISKARGWPLGRSLAPPKVDGLERFEPIRDPRSASDDIRPIHSRPANGPFPATGTVGNVQ